MAGKWPRRAPPTAPSALVASLAVAGRRSPPPSDTRPVRQQRRARRRSTCRGCVREAGASLEQSQRAQGGCQGAAGRVRGMDTGEERAHENDQKCVRASPAHLESRPEELVAGLEMVGVVLAITCEQGGSQKPLTTLHQRWETPRATRWTQAVARARHALKPPAGGARGAISSGITMDGSCLRAALHRRADSAATAARGRGLRSAHAQETAGRRSMRAIQAGVGDATKTRMAASSTVDT